MWVGFYFSLCSLVLWVSRWIFGWRYFDLHDLAKALNELQDNPEPSVSVALLAKRCRLIQAWFGWQYFDPNHSLQLPIKNILNRMLKTPHHVSYASLILSFGEFISNIKLIGPTTEMQWSWNKVRGWQLEQQGVSLHVNEVVHEVLARGALSHETCPWLLHMHLNMQHLQNQNLHDVRLLSQLYDALKLSVEMVEGKLIAIKHHWYHGWFITHQALDEWVAQLKGNLNTIKDMLKHRFIKYWCDPWSVLQDESLYRAHNRYVKHIELGHDFAEHLRRQWLSEWQVQRACHLFTLSWCDLVIYDANWVSLLKPSYPALAIIHQLLHQSLDLAWGWDKLIELDDDQQFWRGYVVQLWYAWYGNLDDWGDVLVTTTGFKHEALIQRVIFQTPMRWCLDTSRDQLQLIEHATSASWSTAQIKYVMFKRSDDEPDWLTMYPLWLWWMQHDHEYEAYWCQQLSRLSKDALLKALAMCPQSLLNRLIDNARQHIEADVWYDIDFFLVSNDQTFKQKSLQLLHKHVRQKSYVFGMAIRADVAWMHSIKRHAAELIMQLKSPITTEDKLYLDALMGLVETGDIKEDIGIALQCLTHESMLNQWFDDEATASLLSYFAIHHDKPQMTSAINDRLRALIWKQMRQAQQSQQLGLWLWMHFHDQSNAWIKQQNDSDFFNLLITHYQDIDGWFIAWPTALLQELYHIDSTFRVNPILSWLVANDLVTLPQSLIKRLRTILKIKKNDTLSKAVNQWIASLGQLEDMVAWTDLSILQCEEAGYGFNSIQTRVTTGMCALSR